MEALVNDYLTGINGAAAADKEEAMDRVLEMNETGSGRRLPPALRCDKCNQGSLIRHAVDRETSEGRGKVRRLALQERVLRLRGLTRTSRRHVQRRFCCASHE